MAIMPHSDSGGIITAVFQPLQSVDQYRQCLPLTDIPNNTAHIVPISLFPFDRTWGFRANVIDDSVHAFDFIYDSIGDMSQNVVGDIRPVGGHAVPARHRAQRNDVVISSFVAHDANSLYW